LHQLKKGFFRATGNPGYRRRRMQTRQLEKSVQMRSKATSAPTHAQTNSHSNADKLHWLQWLHEMLPDADSIYLFAVNQNQTITLCATSPDTGECDESVTNAVLSCVHRAKPQYLENRAHPNNNLLSVPLKVESEHVAHVFVMRTRALNEIQQNTAVRLAQWAAVQMGQKHASRGNTEMSAAMTSATEANTGPEAQLAQSLMNAIDRHGTFTSLAFTLVNSIASLCGCVRVSMGCHDGKTLRLVAMSGQSKIDDRRKIARQLCALMQDTLECRRAIFPNEDAEAAPALQSYFKSQGEHPLLSFLMPGSLRDRFVLVLEREAHEHFSTAQADAIEQSVKNVAALMALSHAQSLSATQKCKRWTSETWTQLISWSNWTTKQWVAAIATAVLLLSFIVPVTHRISAEAYIEASDRQVLVAPQDGFILSAHARAGEFVAKGNLLATLDGQNLQLAAEKWHSEKVKNEQNYAQALAMHDRSELSRLRADVQRIDAEIALVEDQIKRSELRAPFDGVLLDGDWTQSLGAPVAKGDILFEIGSAEQYRLVLEVDEHDIGYVRPEQLAQLRMAALPTTQWDAKLGDVLPVAVSEKGRAAFRIPATIAGDASALQPGMEGVGKVEVGSRSIFWVYTHKMLDRVRYLGWKLGLL